jgi:hypothetical protein
MSTPKNQLPFPAEAPKELHPVSPGVFERGALRQTKAAR